MKKEISKRKVFQVGWLAKPEFKDWLREIPENKHKGFCFFCNATIICGKSELEKHGKSSKHLNNMQNASAKVSDYRIKQAKKVRTAKEKLKNFIDDYLNDNDAAAQHLIPVLRLCFPDSTILQDMEWEDEIIEPIKFEECNLTMIPNANGSNTVDINILENAEHHQTLEENNIDEITINENELSESPETRKLSTTSIQRLVFLEQLAVLRLKKQKLLDEQSSRNNF